MIRYENRYGTLDLEPLEYGHVSKAQHSNTPDELKFDTDTAEKIALITENRHIQLVPPWPITKPVRWFVAHHSSPSICATCRIVSLVFTSKVNPREEIAREAQCSSPFIV